MTPGDGPDQFDESNYHHVNHTAVQTCGWTDNALTGDGRCYKHHFYGIASHRCVQMTPVVKCNERCVFCWRDHEGHTHELSGVEWDDPAAVVEASMDLQRKLLSGYGGHDEVPRERFEEAMEPRHVAISLDGEPTLYPHLPELIEEYHDRGVSTFLVSNGTRPSVIRDVEPTQLYVSVDAPDQETFANTVHPVTENAWDRLMDTLDVLAEKDTRTVIRTTCVDGVNMSDPDGYAALYQRADPDFVELKAYMHVGHSRNRLDREAMPEHDRILSFADEIRAHLPDHDVRKDVPISRVAMLAKDEDTGIPSLAD